MRICLFTHTFPRFKEDNAAPFMAGLATGLAKSGNQVFVLTPYHPRFKSLNGNFKVVSYKYIFPSSWHQLGYSQTLSNDMKLKPQSYLLSPFLFIFGFFALLKLVKKEKIDIINAHWILPNGFIASLVSKITGVPLVITLPGSDVYFARKNFFFKSLAIAAVKTSVYVTSNSKQLISDLKKLGLEYPSTTIMYGVDPDKFRPNIKAGNSLKKKLGINRSSIVVLGVGRLVAKKGFEYLIRGGQKILQKSNVVFVIVGDGDQRGFLENLAEKLNIKSKVIFTGAINYQDLPDYYNLADIFILPSIRDKAGNLDDQSVAIMEAMASGKVVVTSDFPGYREIITDGRDGFLIKEKRSEEIIKILSKLIKSEGLREKAGKKARTLILKKYSWDLIGQKYINLFKTLI